MTVEQLIDKLQKYPKEERVLLCAHGSCSVAEQNEIIGCFKEKIWDDDNNVIEEVVTLYEY